MKLKNKKTGEIGYLIVYKGSDHYFVANDELESCGKYDSLAELNEEWEDAPEEPKEYWYIYADGDIYKDVQDDVRKDNGCKQIGNYFETKEEAEKAVEKLKAWKRLKDKEFKVDLWDYDGTNYQEGIITGRILFRVKDYGRIKENDKDLDLLFGGEE